MGKILLMLEKGRLLKWNYKLICAIKLWYGKGPDKNVENVIYWNDKVVDKFISINSWYEILAISMLMKS